MTLKEEVHNNKKETEDTFSDRTLLLNALNYLILGLLPSVAEKSSSGCRYDIPDLLAPLLSKEHRCHSP